MSNELMPTGGRAAEAILSAPEAVRAPVPARPVPPPRHTPPAKPGAGLSQREKAAVILRLLSADTREAPVAGLEAATLARLLKSMAQMSFVDAATTRGASLPAAA